MIICIYFIFLGTVVQRLWSSEPAATPRRAHKGSDGGRRGLASAPEPAPGGRRCASSFRGPGHHAAAPCAQERGHKGPAWHDRGGFGGRLVPTPWPPGTLRHPPPSLRWTRCLTTSWSASSCRATGGCRARRRSAWPRCRSPPMRRSTSGLTSSRCCCSRSKFCRLLFRSGR